MESGVTFQFSLHFSFSSQEPIMQTCIRLNFLRLKVKFKGKKETESIRRIHKHDKIVLDKTNWHSSGYRAMVETLFARKSTVRFIYAFEAGESK